MRTVRFFCESLSGDRARLDPVQSRHLRKVLRLTLGDRVEVFDGKGLLADARVERVEPDAVELSILEKSYVPPKASGRVILAVSMAKSDRFAWLVEKCTELGVDHIAAVQYDRTVKMGKPSSRRRYEKIALAAVKQSGRLHLPTVTGPETFHNTIDTLLGCYPDAVRLYGDPEGQRLPGFDQLMAQPDRVVFIGPEGGFSATEIQIFADLNVQGVCVNPNILRIETAAVAFSAVLCGPVCN